MLPNSPIPQPPVPSSRTQNRPLPRGVQFGFVVTGVLWAVVASAAARLFGFLVGVHGNGAEVAGLARAVAFAALLACGFSVIVWLAARHSSLRDVNALPWRRSGGAEWRAGLVTGWGMALLAVLPMVLVGDLQPSFEWHGPAWGAALVNLLTLVFVALAAEVLYRGFLLKRLANVIGMSGAVLLLSAAAAVMSMRLPDANWTSVCVTFLLAILLSLAYVRTHAVWLGWGLHFGWLATQGVLFGLPAADVDYSSVVQSNDVGRLWLTGGFYGPAGSWIAAAVVLLAIPVVYVVTRDWSWEYTHELPVGAAYAVVVQPPAAHVQMETQASATAQPLIQILPSTPAGASSVQVVNQHLRETE